MKAVFFFAALLLFVSVNADLYMHNMRGSNNRLNENNDNRNTANRLFDSQNNNRGGYNVGDETTAQDGNGVMNYYASSILQVSWTNQHGAGNPNVHTQLVFQYLCNENTPPYDNSGATDVRDGTTTNRIDPADADNAANGRHEPAEYYNDCAARERNHGLFTADQNLNGDQAIYTRQNTNGNRNGLECTEERDYYPYWHPTPWKDIIILTSNTTQCTLYQEESQNVKGKNYCSVNTENNLVDCEAAGGTWNEAPAHDIPAPECREVGWSRDNHLGDTLGGGNLYFNWTIPEDMVGKTCVLRARYNISTNDYDGWAINSTYNDDMSPIQDNPTVDFGDATDEDVRVPKVVAVKLGLNTDQYGRTFQDRSHTFTVSARPAEATSGNIYNLNVRGRRGNIVQVYPAVEYDFVPNRLTVTTDDWVHIQWTGSLNTPAGAGQGAENTDRSNIVCIASLSQNYPLSFDDDACTLFDTTQKKIDFATVGVGAGVDDELDNAPAYYDGGLVKPGNGVPGEYPYMCTRNNSFTNRSQKGKITVVSA